MGPVTFSAGEDFAVAMKGTKRGTMIGEATGGSTGQPLNLRLPGGGWGRVCAKRDRGTGGLEFVGKGVQPDITMPLTIRELQLGQDSPLAKAVEVVTKGQR